MASLNFISTEHSPNIGRDIDLYKDINPHFPEDLVLLYKITFEEEEGQGNEAEKLEGFKKELNQRKQLDSFYLSQLLFVNFKVLSGLCVNKVQCRVSFEYSEMNLQKYANEKKIQRGSMLNSQAVSSQQIYNFLQQTSDGLLCLKRNGMFHGFVIPENILMYNLSTNVPNFKLLDVKALSRYKSCFERMQAENDYFAPLDP